jgi:hypothetical protein
MNHPKIPHCEYCDNFGIENKTHYMRRTPHPKSEIVCPVLLNTHNHLQKTQSNHNKPQKKRYFLKLPKIKKKEETIIIDEYTVPHLFPTDEMDSVITIKADWNMCE